MADSNRGNLPLEIDILIGADHYWDFMQYKIVRGKSGPVAMSSILGYIISVEISGSLGSPFHSFNVGSTHLLRVQSEIFRPVSEGRQKRFFGVEKK